MLALVGRLDVSAAPLRRVGIDAAHALVDLEPDQDTAVKDPAVLIASPGEHAGPNVAGRLHRTSSTDAVPGWRRAAQSTPSWSKRQRSRRVPTRHGAVRSAPLGAGHDSRARCSDDRGTDGADAVVQDWGR